MEQPWLQAAAGDLGQFGGRTRHHLFLSFNACSIAGAASVSDPEWRRDSGASPSTMRILSSAKTMTPRRVADFFHPSLPRFVSQVLMLNIKGLMLITTIILNNIFELDLG